MTDANLILGRLGPDCFLGGEMSLDLERARYAVDGGVAGPLGISVEEAAEGIVRVINATMIKGIRVVSVAKGYDPREFCMLAFGGAGPVHAGELAAELEIPRQLIPIAPGVTSALGLLMADMRHDYVRTVLSLAGESAPGDLERRYRQMEVDALRQMRREGLAGDSVSLVRLADLRYLGQGFELEVLVAGGGLEAAQIDEAVERFHSAHKRRYGYASTENPVEIVNLRLTALAKLPHPRLAPERLNGTTNPSGPLKGHREVYFGKGFVPTAVYDRQGLGPGDAVTGPAIVEQLDSTTVVWPDQTARVDPYRNLVLERSGQR